MENPRITVSTFEELMPHLCDRETSLDPERWMPENPLWGHCAVVSVIAQELFGGQLFRASLAGSPGFGENDSHYWNVLPTGVEHDFTRSQFGNRYPRLENSVTRTREYVLFGPKDADEKTKMRFAATRNRYKLLKWRIERHLSENNPLFNDEIYRACFFEALESSCQKMRFGCVVAYRNGIFTATHNNVIEPLRHLCEPTCCRSGIQSRTEQMLGACGHAEEWALDEIQKYGILSETCTLYVAGFYPDGRPYIKTAPEHTCLRCSLQMYRAGIGHIAVPVVDHWEFLTTEEAVKTAVRYATG